MAQAESESMRQAVELVKADRKIIKEGLAFGKRKAALTKLLKRNKVIVEALRDIEEESYIKEEKIAELKQQVESSKEKFFCSLELFRFEFIGVSSNKEIAKKKALIKCSEKFNLTLQCRGGTFSCI